jgi:hypothetical protein
MGSMNSHRLRHVASKGSIKMSAYEMYKLDKSKIIRSLSPSPVAMSRKKPQYLKDSGRYQSGLGNYTHRRNKSNLADYSQRDYTKRNSNFHAKKSSIFDKESPYDSLNYPSQIQI